MQFGPFLIKVPPVAALPCAVLAIFEQGVHAGCTVSPAVAGHGSRTSGSLPSLRGLCPLIRSATPAPPGLPTSLALQAPSRPPGGALRRAITAYAADRRFFPFRAAGASVVMANQGRPFPPEAACTGFLRKSSRTPATAGETPTPPCPIRSGMTGAWQGRIQKRPDSVSFRPFVHL